jgi:hypothetical protein
MYIHVLAEVIASALFCCDIMKLEHESIKDENDKVIGVIMRIHFAEIPRRSKDGTGPNLMDFSSHGNKVLDLGNGIIYKMGLNIYHKAD